MNKQRLICFIDGFNLYHAIDKLNMPYLKWLNLWSLASCFVRRNSQQLYEVLYFSAYAEWNPVQKLRHRQYVIAQNAFGVKAIMGKYKNKDRNCKECGYKWKGHEEKETDVNIALAMLNKAYRNEYDHALLISNDSDFTPAINMVLTNFPNKKITTIAPPHTRHSNELINSSSFKSKITLQHLKKSLLPKVIYDNEGKIISKCPIEYFEKEKTNNELLINKFSLNKEFEKNIKNTKSKVLFSSEE